jgi:hypothetical protein
MSDAPVSGTLRGQVPARVLDLSPSGALLALGPALEVGSINDFALDLEGETMWVQGEVRRCSVDVSGHQVGVEFIGIDPRDERRLRAYLDRRRKPA